MSPYLPPLGTPDKEWPKLFNNWDAGTVKCGIRMKWPGDFDVTPGSCSTANMILHPSTVMMKTSTPFDILAHETGPFFKAVNCVYCNDVNGIRVYANPFIIDPADTSSVTTTSFTYEAGKLFEPGAVSNHIF